MNDRGDGVMLISRTPRPHDLHVAVRVRAETALRLHDVVVDNSQDTEVSRPASVFRETEMKAAREPVLARPLTIGLVRRVAEPARVPVWK